MPTTAEYLTGLLPSYTLCSFGPSVISYMQDRVGDQFRGGSFSGALAWDRFSLKPDCQSCQPCQPLSVDDFALPDTAQVMKRVDFPIFFSSIRTRPLSTFSDFGPLKDQINVPLRLRRVQFQCQTAKCRTMSVMAAFVRDSFRHGSIQ